MALTDFLRRYSYAIAPGLCLLCSQSTGRAFDLCEGCESELPTLGKACDYCAEPMATDGGAVCAPCLKTPPHFSAALCAFEYAHPVDHLLQRFKDHGHQAAGCVLTRLAAVHLNETLNRLPRDQILLTSVPLHWRKFRRRGFNQSKLIADWLNKSVHLPAEHSLLRRRRDSISQRALNATSRRDHLRGAFRVSKPELIKNNTVLLIDDVITTTSTAGEISRTLLEHGAADVIVIALARTPRNSVM